MELKPVTSSSHFSRPPLPVLVEPPPFGVKLKSKEKKEYLTLACDRLLRGLMSTS